MSHQRSNEDLRSELKSLADTLEEVLNSSADKSSIILKKWRVKRTTMCVKTHGQV